MPGSAKTVVMNLRRKAQGPALLGKFSIRFGQETLSVRVYRDGASFILERCIVERDGTSYTVVLPFKEVAAIHGLLTTDPYLENAQSKAKRIALSLERGTWNARGKPSS